MLEPRVLIVGGGAAGLCAAIASARQGAPVTVLEADARVGRKILASGNGRCNLTNRAVSPEDYNHPAFVTPVLSEYSGDTVCDFFGSMGLLTAADDEGRVYPTTNTASSVLDVLRYECTKLNVEIRCGHEAVGISRRESDRGFDVLTRGGYILSASAVVVSTGVGTLLESLGHTSIDPVPVLGPLRTGTERIRGLSGVRVRCSASLIVDADDDAAGGRVVATEHGELLFRDYGVSGIMVFDLSRYLEAECVLSVDLFPAYSNTELGAMLVERRDALGWRTAETFCAGMLHDRVARAILRLCDLRPDTPARELDLDVMATLLKDFRLPVLGMGDAAQAQVTRGGACVSQFDPRSMESLCVEGLFAAGEVLDIDGRSGGFNLHWAWASGMTAGQAATRKALSSAHASRGSGPA